MRLGRTAAIVPAIAAAALAALGACIGATAPQLPANAVAFKPPAEYRLWWQVTESCAARTRTFDDIHWYYVPGAVNLIVGGEQYAGVWLPRLNAIVLGERSMVTGRLVRHEMLHALVGTGHSASYFGQRCGGIVSCEDECATEAGMPPSLPDTAPILPITAVVVGDSVLPSEISETSDSGWVVIVASVVNPRPASAWVPLTPMSGGGGAAKTFSYEIKCLSECAAVERSGYEYTYDSRFAAPAGVVRRTTFDAWLPPGLYSVVTAFNADSSAARTIRIGP